MNTFVILPNQLFGIEYLKNYKEYSFIIYEHPHYFTKYNYNKKKLLLHKASMEYYNDYLKKNSYTTTYIKYNEPFNVKIYTMFDPIDKIIKINKNIKILESPNFILSTNDMIEYNKIHPKFLFKTFYDWSRKKHNIIPDIKSQDKDNRKKIPKNIDIPNVSALSKKDTDYINSSKKYIDTHFAKNCGNTDNFIYPVTHETAKKWLIDFIKNKMNNFGNYEDAIQKNESYLFHSVLSSSLNIGLLNASTVIDTVIKNKASIPLNSFEGFVRQIFWREFMKYTYLYFDFTQNNYFNNNKKLTNDWYNGTLDIEPVDDCIIKAFDTGYLHHIERLMIIGNFMNLSGISADEGFKWFMEFAIDRLRVGDVLKCL